MKVLGSCRKELGNILYQYMKDSIRAGGAAVEFWDEAVREPEPEEKQCLKMPPMEG